MEDRIRTWARTKAHGPAPLVAKSRRPGSRPQPAAGGGPVGAQTEPSAGGAGEAAPAAPAAPENEKPAQQRPSVFMRFLIALKDIIFSSPVNILLVFVPIGIAVKAVNMSAGVIFAMNAIAIIPLAGLLSYATESVAKKLGDAVGALMNITFGNAVELIIL